MKGFAVQYKALACGTPQKKRDALKILREIAAVCRARAVSSSDPDCETIAARSKKKPWSEFRKITGPRIFRILLKIARKRAPSEERELAMDIMAQLWHPCAVRYLCNKFEQHGDILAERPPLIVFANLGGIGTPAAARALIGMWGTKWDADVVSALVKCRSKAAHEFIVRQAYNHSRRYIRLICLMHIVPPLTKGKVDLLLERLRSGTQDEQFVAVLKIKSLGVVQAVEALKILRSKDIPEMLANMIDEALMALNLCLSVALAPGHWGGGRPSQENPVKKRILR